MKVYFSISELCITDDTVPLVVADKLLKYHITPMNAVREELGIPVTASQKSGYRPRQWELDHNRSGDSQHCFVLKGAVDWTCQNFSGNKNELLRLIIKHTDYTRIAVYNGFIHCDYKTTAEGKRQLFTSNSSSSWTFVKNV